MIEDGVGKKFRNDFIEKAKEKYLFMVSVSRVTKRLKVKLHLE